MGILVKAYMQNGPGPSYLVGRVLLRQGIEI